MADTKNTDLISKLYQLFDAAWEENMNERGNDITRMVTTFIPDAIQELQAKEEAEPVRQGQWIRDYTYTGKNRQKYVCSLCAHYQMNRRQEKDTCALYMNYCPQCGAKMDGERRSE
jgi:hypothetical protein